MSFNSYKRGNAYPKTLSPELHQQLCNAFNKRYKPGERRNRQEFLNDWVKKLPDILQPPPTPQTITDFLINYKSSRECWLIDGLCQLLLDGSVYEISKNQEKSPIIETNVNPQIFEPVIQPASGFINNPFQPLNGLIEEPDLFFGRDHEIKKTFNFLNNGSSVAIIGESKIGKSSLLMEISRQAQTELRQPRKPIYLDLLNIHDQDQFYEELCYSAQITTCRGNYLKRNLKNHRFLLILDNVEKMTWEGFTNYIYVDLRGLAEGENAILKLVFAACTSLDQLFGSQGIKMGSPWWGIFTEYQLNRWDEQTIRDFIASRLNLSLLEPEYKTITFTEDEITELINKSEGHPQKLMALCYQLFNRYLEELS